MSLYRPYILSDHYVICYATYYVKEDKTTDLSVGVIGFIARQHAVHAERDIVLSIPSVRLSVRPLPVNVSNGHIVTLFDALVGTSF